MPTIIVKTQAEIAALPVEFKEWTVIEIRSSPDVWLTIAKVPSNSRVVARESSRVEAWGSSSVVARESSRVVAWESSSVEAWESSRVEARGSSSVEAWGSSSVEAWGSSSVVARESSRVEAWGSSRVVARESSRVVARESSRVEAWGSSSVEAWGSSSVHVQNVDVTVNLFAFAVCFAHLAGKIMKHARTATIIQPIIKPGVTGWLEKEAIQPAAEVVLFKRVSKDWKTQEGTEHETPWPIGATLAHPAWSPKERECGEGKFHACSRTYFCDEFRGPGHNFGDDKDRYIAIAVKRKDLYAWPNAEYPHKIAFRVGRVLHECDKWGEKIVTAAEAAK